MTSFFIVGTETRLLQEVGFLALKSIESPQTDEMRQA
jgi:hypothetical protein